jgi:hypothetical protein
MTLPKFNNKSLYINLNFLGMKYWIFFFIFLLVINLSCTKKGEYDCYSALEITADNITPTVGDDLTINANTGQSIYTWSGPLNYAESKADGSSGVTFNNIKINQSGWYYCASSLPGCNTLYDSIYIDVKYKQGSPACSLTDNVVEGDLVPTLHAFNVSKSFDPSWNCKMLYASGNFGYPTYRFGFNSYNGDTEPKDGIYVTHDVQAFDPFQDANVIYIQCQYSNLFFRSRANKEVYVSHINGKLRIAFCDLEFGGDDGGGNYFTGTFTGQVTEE